MKIANCTMRGFNSSKTYEVSELILYKDLICLTETWSDIEPNDN